jgi:hypothetical protein
MSAGVNTSNISRSTESKNALVPALAIILTLAVSAGLAEIATRLAGVRTFRTPSTQYLGWAKRDPVLGWRNNPGVWRADEPPHAPMTFLPDGSRATGTPASASGDPVVVIGCSFAEGYGLPDDETFTWLLQQRFPRRPVLNFATPGYGTYQSLQLLDELIGTRKIHPAAVIYGFLPQHAARNVLTSPLLEAFRAFGGQRFSPPHVELHDGQLRMFPPFVVSNWPLEDHSALVTLAHQAELRALLAGRDRDEEQVTNQLIAKMSQMAEKEHARFLVATLWDDLPPGLAAYQRMAASMRKAGIEETDVTYRGAETNPVRLHVGGVGHPGPAIDEWWANKLSAWLGQVEQ